MSKHEWSDLCPCGRRVSPVQIEAWVAAFVLHALKVESLFWRPLVGGREAFAYRCASRGEITVLLFAQVLHDVPVGLFRLFNLPHVYDRGTGQMIPVSREPRLRDVTAPGHEVVMGPALFCEFEYAEVFEFTEFLSDVSHEATDRSPGTVEGVTWSVVPRRIDRERDQFGGFRVRRDGREAFRFLFAAESACPPLAGLGDDDFARKRCRPCGQSGGVMAGVESAERWG